MDTKRQLLTDLSQCIDSAKARNDWRNVERYTAAWHMVNGSAR